MKISKWEGSNKHCLGKTSREVRVDLDLIFGTFAEW